MLIFIYGKDSFRSRDYLRSLVENFKQKRDSVGLNVVKIDCEKNKETLAVWNEIASVPFLAEKKMIILEKFFSSKNTSLVEFFLQKIKSGFFEKEENNVVVVWDDIDSVKSKIEKEIFNFFIKLPYSKEFSVLKEDEMCKWLIDKATKNKGKVDKRAAIFIAKNSKDIWQADSLLNQLLAFKNGEVVTEEDARLFLEERADDNIFNLVDTILAKNTKTAYLMIREQYETGEDAQFIFAMLFRQCRILYEIKDLMDREGKIDSNTMAKTLGLHPFVVKKSLGMANRYSINQLKNLYRELLDFDIKTKTGQGSQNLLLDFLVGKMSI